MADDGGFLGTGWAFPPRFDPRTGAAMMVSREEDVVQSLRILLATQPGERVMHPTFGCGIRRMVFEEIHESTITELKDIVSRAVLFFEPRITLERIDAMVEDPLEGLVRLTLEYTIRDTNTRANLVFPLYLSEATMLGGPDLAA
ncbi:MAG: GPW/gp25 family protein [Pseudomonadota bacterium]|nr:GPW/gp25 family protein [Betaproteobacteria bacterium]